MKAGDRVEWYNLFYQVCEGVIVGTEGLRRARMDDGYEVLVDPNPERVFRPGTLDKAMHEQFIKTLKVKTQMNTPETKPIIPFKKQKSHIVYKTRNGHEV